MPWLLAGCGGSAARNSKELSFWNFYGPSDTGDPKSKWFVDLADMWNRQNDVKVKLHYVPVADYTAGTSLQTAFSSGAGPDIFLISPGDFLRYYNGGVLTDLTPYLSPQSVADYVPNVLDTRKVNDKIYGLPMEIEPLAMYYGVDAFEKAGLSEADLPRTWDQLLSVAERLTTKDRFGVLFETTPGYYQNFTFYPFMWMGEANTLSPDQKTSTFNKPGAVAALEFWRTATTKGFAPKKVQGEGGHDAVANLAAGYCAMQETGIWSVAQIQQKAPTFRYGVFPLPIPSGGKPVTDGGGWAMVANAKGANPEAAAKFIAWALGDTSPEGVERGRQWNTVVKTNLPPRKSVQQAADSAGAFGQGALATFANQVRPTVRSEPRYPPEVYKAISDAIQAAQLSNVDPRTAADEAVRKINTFLGSYSGAAIL